MWADLSLNCFSGYELDSHYGDCFQSNITYVILKGSLQPAIFIHGRVPTWIKDWSLFNHLLSLREMFWLASHGLATLSFEAPTCAFVCARWTNSRQSCHRRKRGFDDDSFTNGPHLINPKSGHMDTREERLPHGEWSDQSHKPLSDPHGFPFTWAGFQSSVLTPKRFTPTWCVRAGLINLFIY